MSVGVIGNKERSAYWDNIKGILILLVVFAHVIYKLQNMSPVIDITVDFIYMFHMPAFIFVSGYFGRSERSRSFESIIKLVFLFFIFNSITVFIEGYQSYLEPIYSYWYLVALIVWRLTAHRISKFKAISVILFVAALIIGFFPAIDNHFAAARIIGFYPFYMLGFMLGEEKNSKFMNIPYWKKAVIGAVLLGGIEAAYFASRLVFQYKSGSLELEPYERPMDILFRVLFFIVAILAIFAIRCFVPDKKIPFITEFGRNSLWIFVFHRLFTLWIGDAVRYYPLLFILAVAVLSSFVLCFLFGNDFFAKYFNKFLDSGAEIFTSDNKKITFPKVVAFLVAIGFAVVAVFNSIALLKENDNSTSSSGTDPQSSQIYAAMTGSQKDAFDNAFRITFAGDLILLEDQVNLGYKDGGYDFSEVFEYAEPYISSADMAIGVFEGPMAGEDKGYSTGNYDDGKELYLNFPDEFGEAVKDAGFDLVTTANNHMLDKGEEGAMRTLDVLDEIGLDHTGTYRNQAEKDSSRIKIVEVDGIKFAVLSYTFGSNYTDKDELIDGQYAYLTSIITGTEGEQFEELKARVEEDFEAAKAMSPDLIIVLPHVGTQFLNDPDETQEVWFNIFKENGADIILGDHPHVVEPATIENVGDKKVFTAYCPGNFANVYREHQGDTSMLVDVYIDRDSKEVIGGSVVPLYTYAPADGNYKAVPVYEIMNNAQVRSELTVDDINRASIAHEIVTRVMFGYPMDIGNVTERYYFDENGFIRSRNSGLELSDEIKDESILYNSMSEADSICFIGDSITEGTKNGGCPWYEPIESFFPDKTIFNYSKGSCTVSYMLDHIDEIPEADLYVIALGTNDVRYRDESVCAMTSDEYTARLNELKDKLLEKSPDAGFVFIAPWYSIDGDPYCSLSFAEKTALNEEYSAALENYCADNDFVFINANDYIRDALKTSSSGTYLLDHIHPNATNGVVLYSEAVLLSGKR